MIAYRKQSDVEARLGGRFAAGGRRLANISTVTLLFYMKAKQRKMSGLVDADQTYDLLNEVQQFDAREPEWDRDSVLSAAKSSYEQGASAMEISAIYGKAIAAQLCGA